MIKSIGDSRWWWIGRLSSTLSSTLVEDVRSRLQRSAHHLYPNPRCWRTSRRKAQDTELKALVMSILNSRRGCPWLCKNLGGGSYRACVDPGWNHSGWQRQCDQVSEQACWLTFWWLASQSCAQCFASPSFLIVDAVNFLLLIVDRSSYSKIFFQICKTTSRFSTKCI